MSIFHKKAIKNGNSLIITLPKEIVELYKINESDILEIDLIKNHRDKNE